MSPSTSKIKNTASVIMSRSAASHTRYTPALPPMRFSFYSKARLIGLDEPLLGALADAIRDEKGRVEYFRVDGRAHKKIGSFIESSNQLV